MARVRLLHPQQTTDEDVNGLSIHARYVWAFLPCHADRSGRLADKPFALKLAVLPVDPVDMNALLQELAVRGLIVRYEHDGRKYIQIRNFNRYQRPHRNEAASTVPPPVGAPPDVHGPPLESQGHPLVDQGPTMDRTCRADPDPVPDPVIDPESGDPARDPVGTEHGAPAPATTTAPATGNGGTVHPLVPSTPGRDPDRITAYDLTHRFGIEWRKRYGLPWAPDRDADAAARDLLEEQIGRMEPDDRREALADLFPAMERYLDDKSPSLVKYKHLFAWFVERFNQYRVERAAAASATVTPAGRPRWTGRP